MSSAIEPITNENDARRSTRLIAEEFALSNPLSVFTQSSADDLFDHWLWPLMMEVLDQHLSFLVRHCPTNEIIAAIIANDLSVYVDRHPYNPSAPASSDPVVDFFDESRDRFIREDFRQVLKSNLILCISAGATRSTHAGHGLAAQLRTHLCRYARDEGGFSYALIQTAHPATRHIYLNRMNGKVTSIIHPADWVWKKHDDGQSRPLKDYQDEPITNILLSF